MKLLSITTEDGSVVTVGEAVRVDGDQIAGIYNVVAIETITTGQESGDIEVLVENNDNAERWLRLWEVTG